MRRNSQWSWISAGILLAWCGVEAASAQWSNAALFNQSSESGNDCKGGQIVASASGGFHGMYISVGGSVRYRKYSGGTLSTPVTLTTGTHFNGTIEEAPNGNIHVIWENWNGSGPEVGWARSTNGGTSFSAMSNISNSTGQAKWPQIAGYGTGSVGDVVMSYWNASTKELRSNRFNGTSWSGDAGMNLYANSQYEVTGIARSRLDGSVYRAYTEGGVLKLVRYNGTWGTPVVLDSSGNMHNRQHVAVNDSGQVMVTWDENDVDYAVLYTPGAGASAKTTITTQGSWGQQLCAIPGTNDFYAAYPKNGPGRLYGRRFAGGGWLTEEQVSQGLGDSFTVAGCLSADPAGSGTIYAIWEFWGNGKPQQYYAIKTGLPPGPRGTLAGTVTDQNGQGVAGVTITVPNVAQTVTTTGGAYTFPIPAGSYTGVTAVKNNYSTGSANVTITANTTTTQNYALTATTPSPVTNLAAKGYDGRVLLTWTNPTTGGTQTGTRIRVKTTGFPTGPTDGTQVADVLSSSSSYIHTGLTNGTTYYYAAYAYFADASSFYSAGTTVSVSPVAPPKTNLLTNGGIDTIVSDVAVGWTGYEVNDPGGGTYLSEDFSNYVTAPAQGFWRLDHASLPATGYTAGGIYQVKTGCTVGKVYLFTMFQDIYTSDFGADGKRYVLNFGINPSGGTTPGTLNFTGSIGGAKWMTADQALYNNNAGSPVRFAGFHKSWAAYPATATSISCWTGVTIDNAGVKDNVTAKFDTDLGFLYEFDVPANAGLQNGNFEGSVLELQNIDPNFGGGDILPASWVPAGGSTGQWSAILTEADGARTGTKGCRVANRRGTVNGGVCQKIACTNGYYQTFSAYAVTSGQDGTVGAVGIDPTGGVDIGSANIVWTTTSSSAWTQITAGATAQGTAITVFLRSSNTNPGGTGNYHYTYFDDCAWSQTSTAPTPGTITGTVTDSCGATIGGATVSTNVGGYTTTTAGNGTYTLASVNPGTYNVTASKSGYTNVTQNGVVVTSGATTTTNLVFTNNKGNITGVVTDQCGIALSGATVSTNTGGYTTTSGADGSYTLANVTAATYTVSAVKAGLVTQNANVTVTACQTKTQNFQMPPLSISEKLVNGNMEGGFFSFWGGSMPNSYGATWRGTFAAATWGSVNVGAPRNNVVQLSGLSSGFEAGIVQTVTGLTPGATYTFSAESYQYDQGTNVWIAVDETGSTSLPARNVSFDNIINQWNSKSITGTVGANGSLSVFVWAYKQWGAGANVRIDNLSLMVQGVGSTATGTITGTVRNSSGTAIAGASVVSSTDGYTATTGTDGTYTITSVAPGSYTFTASKSGYANSSQVVNVVGCQTTTANFTLQTQATPVEKLANGTMEAGWWATGWGGGSVLPNEWDGWYNPGDFNCFQELTIKHGGANAAKTSISAGGNSGTGGNKRSIFQSVYIGPNTGFTFKVWARHNNGNCPSIMCWNPDSDTNPHNAYSAGRYQWVTTDNWGQLNSWVTRTMTGTAPASGYITIMVGGAHHGGGGAGDVYVDDVSVTVP